MTDLQISLIAIGGVVVVGVVVYNKWQERKARKSLERAFSSLYDDVLMQPGQEADNHDFVATREPVEKMASRAERVEPELQAPIIRPPVKGSVLDAYSSFMEDDDEDEVAVETPRQEEAVKPVARKPKKPLPVDDLIDCRIPIALDAPLRGEKILAAIQSVRHAGKKPVSFIGCNESGEWETIEYGIVYTSLLAGVQLANRSSQLNEIEYSELVMQLRQMADSLNGEPDIPDMMDVMKSAQHLYQFIMDHDAQLGVNVRSNGAPWDIVTLRAALLRQGFDRATDGYLVMQDGEGDVLFSLSFNAGPNDDASEVLTFLLDVPRVGAARNGYQSMIACAKAFATRMNGRLVDDSDQPLSDTMLEDIGEQVAAFYSAMASADVMAGSRRAMRLFS